MIARVVLAGALLVSLVAAAILYGENRRLARELGEARRPAANAAEPTAPPAEDPAADADRRSRRSRPADGLAALGAVARAVDRAQASQGREGQRERRRDFVRETLARRPGETDQAYADRVVPAVTAILVRPRDRMEERRREFEQAAELTEPQRAEIDRAIGEAQAELLDIANRAVASGEITPYRRNTPGLLTFAAAVAPVAEGFDARLQKILTPEQLAILEQTGFDWTQYGAVTTAWESLRPPPPQSSR